jgi:hypothetical protein
MVIVDVAEWKVVDGLAMMVREAGLAVAEKSATLTVRIVSDVR